MQRVGIVFSLLCVPLEGLNPAEKYFLLRLVDSHRGTLEIPFSASQLAKRFGVGKHVVGSVLKFLLELECVGKTRGDTIAPQGKQVAGKPPTNYRFRKANLEELLSRVQHPVASGKHQALIGEVLSGSGFQDLTIPQRLLLAVMLSYADECGAVRGLGISKLGELAGMKPDRCKRCLKELAVQQYVIGRTAGATGAKIFGVCAGLHVLDLKKCYRQVKGSNVKSPWKWSEYIVDPICIDQGLRLYGLVNQLVKLRGQVTRGKLRLNAASNAGRPADLIRLEYDNGIKRINGVLEDVARQVGCKVEEEPLVTFFSTRAGSAEPRLLQMKLEQYAALIFDAGLDGGGEDPDCFICPAFNQVLDDVVPSSFRARMGDCGVPSADAYRSMAEMICRLARDLAETLRCEVHAAGHSEFMPRRCKLVIVPQEEGRQKRRVLVANKRRTF